MAEIKDDEESSREIKHHQERATKSEPKFIMPAVLKSASEEELIALIPTSSDEKAAPLKILFKNGFVPFGVFCASTANLIARQDSVLPRWQLRSNQIMKNKVTFSIDDSFYATLISRPQYIEIRVEKPQQSESDYSLCDICSTVRQTVVATLEAVISMMKYTQYSKTESSSKHLFDLGFACSLDDTHSDHFMVIARNKHHSKCLKDCLRLPLKNEHLVWFEMVTIVANIIIMLFVLF